MDETDTTQFIALTDQWRRDALKLDHRAFAKFLGRYESEWSMYRSGERLPSRRFIAAVLAKAPEPWKSALEKAYLADLTAARVPVSA